LCACSLIASLSLVSLSCNDSPTPDTSTLSLHDALPILALVRATGWTGAIGGMGLVFAFAGAIFAIQAAPVANAVFLFAAAPLMTDRKSTRLNSSHVKISYAVFCLKKKRKLKLNKALTRT